MKALVRYIFSSFGLINALALVRSDYFLERERERGIHAQKIQKIIHLNHIPLSSFFIKKAMAKDFLISPIICGYSRVIRIFPVADRLMLYRYGRITSGLTRLFCKLKMKSLNCKVLELLNGLENSVYC
jgi:hypothetical protein